MMGHGQAGDGGGEAAALADTIADDAEPERASRLLRVGTQIDGGMCEQALFTLAAERRQAGGSYVAEFGAVLLDRCEASQAQLFQDVFAFFVSGFASNGYFVEVGTGDGKLISNTWLLEKEFGWTGLVVEPNPAFLPALRAHRTCRIATECILDISGRSVAFRCTADPEFSFIDGAGEQTHDEPGTEPVRTVTLQTLSLNDLLTREGCPHRIDYLSIDVEGAEFDILQAFDFAAWDIKCLTVEHNHTASRDKVFLLLAAQGYVRVLEQFSQWDDWYVHRSVLAQVPSAHALLAFADEAATAAVLPGQFVQWAVSAIGRGELPAAEALCERALADDPQFAAAFRTLADIAVMQRRYGLALERWRAAVAANPDDYWSRFGLGEALAARGLLREAVAQLDVAVVLDPAGHAAALRETLLPKLEGRR